MGKKERILELMEKNHIDNYASLLARIGAKLKKKDLGLFVDKNKPNFSKMINGERKFNYDYIVPLEEILNTSFRYIEIGEGNDCIKLNASTRLEEIAISNKYEEFEKLDILLDKNNDPIIKNFDEYQMSIADYIVKHDSIEGVRYLVNKHKMEFSLYNCIMLLDNDISHIFIDEKIPLEIAKLICKFDDSDLFFSIFNVYSIYDYIDETRNLYKNKEFLKAILSTENIFKELLEHEKIEYKCFNQHLLNNGDKEGYFVSPVINYVLNYAISESNVYEDKILKILNKGISYNNVSIHEAEKHFPQYIDILKVDNNGFLKFNDTKCGCIINCESLLVDVSEEIRNKVDELNNTNKNLMDSLKKNWDGSSIVNYLNKGEYTYKKHSNNKLEYDMYNLMNKEKFSYIPKFISDEKNMDKFERIEGEIDKARFSQSAFKILELANFLKEFHCICKKNLNGKVYVHNYLNSHNLMYDDKDSLICVIGWENCSVGEDYEDLVRLIWNGCNIENFHISDREFILSMIKNILKEYDASPEIRKNLSVYLEKIMKEDLNKLEKDSSNYEYNFVKIRNSMLFVELYADKLNSL